MPDTQATGTAGQHVVEVHGHLTEPAFRRIGELLGQSLGRHKAHSTRYVFGPMTAAQAGAVCAYLQEISVPHDRQTTTQWPPAAAAASEADPRPVYEVTVTRTERIAFELPAADADDAEVRYLLDGDETGSKTVSIVVESVALADGQEEDTTEYYRCSCGSDVVVSEQAGHQGHCGGHPLTYWTGARP